MSEWYYTRAGQQVGPVTAAQLKQAAQSGQFGPSDMVWKEGMPNWVPATKLRGLFDGTAHAAVPSAAAANAHLQPAPLPESATPSPADHDLEPAAHAAHHYAPQQSAPSSIGYYNPTAGLGARLAANMKGFPPPTGSQDEWPLTDAHLGQLAIAEGHRKHIRNLAALFHLFFVLGVIVSVVFVLIAFFGLALGGGGGRRGAGIAATGMLIVAVLVVAFTVLYYFAARQTRRCRTWPAITFAVLYALSIVVNFASMFMALGSAGQGPGASAALGAGMFGAVIGSIIPFAFLYMCIKALTSIPKFLACPVWAQEALVTAKL